HLTTSLIAAQTSGAIDHGVRCSNAAVPPPTNPLAACSATAVVAPSSDIDNQFRPQLRSLRVRTPWDLGADEVPTILPTLAARQFRTQGFLTRAQTRALRLKIEAA